MEKINCAWAEETLLEFAAGRLDSDTRAGVERHLGECESCRTFAAAQQRVWSALDACDAPEASPGFDRALYARLAAPLTWRERLSAALQPAWVRRGAPVCAAAGLVFVAVLAFRPPAGAPSAPAGGQIHVAPVELLRPDQLEGAVRDIETLQEFYGLIRQESGEME